MKVRKLRECFKTLFEHFSDPFYQGYEGSMEDRILDFYDKEHKFLEVFFGKEYKEKGFKVAEEVHGNFLTFRFGIIQAAFCYGFTIGRLLDPAWNHVKEAEEAILEDIKKKELQLYLPRGKAARPHETLSNRV